jgi:hypothetical protein
LAESSSGRLLEKSCAARSSPRERSRQQQAECVFPRDQDEPDSLHLRASLDRPTEMISLQDPSALVSRVPSALAPLSTPCHFSNTRPCPFRSIAFTVENVEHASASVRQESRSFGLQVSYCLQNAFTPGVDELGTVEAAAHGEI